MPQGKLVLLKPKGLRVAEAIIFPAIALPFGPVVRALMGNQYSPFYAFTALILVMLLVNALITRWAVSRDGEWMSPSERNRRLAAEATATPSWLAGLETGASFALLMIASQLIIDPIDEFGGVFGGTPMTLALIAVPTLLMTGQVFYARRQLVRQLAHPQTELDKASAEGPKFSLWPALPLIYLANAVAVIAGLAVASQLGGDQALGAYLITSLAIRLYLEMTKGNGEPFLLAPEADTKQGRWVILRPLNSRSLDGTPECIRRDDARVLRQAGLL